MQYQFKSFRNKLASMSWNELEAMFEQYQEMESRSIGDEIRQEMIAHELDARESEDEFERVRYDVYEY